MTVPNDGMEQRSTSRPAELKCVEAHIHLRLLLKCLTFYVNQKAKQKDAAIYADFVPVTARVR